MKTLPLNSLSGRRHQRGIFLIDCLVYISMFFLVTGLAFELCYKCWDNSLLARRSADDIAATLNAGERWRADVRQATAVLRVEDTTDGPVLLIPRAAGAIRYRFSQGEICRQSGDNAAWAPVLSRVKSSTMSPDNRPHVAAWRWEVELQPRQKHPHMLPLFTFETVPGPPNNQ